jgi:hypothetical protein
LPSTCSWPRLIIFRFGPISRPTCSFQFGGAETRADRELVDHALMAVHRAQARQQGRLAGFVGDGAGHDDRARWRRAGASARTGAAARQAAARMICFSFTWRLR